MNDLIAQAGLIGFAAWRLTAFMTYERGPYDIFLRFREQLGYTHKEDGTPETWPGGWREIFSCPWCLGPWMAAATYGLWELEPLIVVVIAASSIVAVIERWNRP